MRSGLMSSSVRCGCDITENARFVPHQEQLAARILHPEELQEYRSRKGKSALLYLARHFAAKESLIKAAGPRPWKSMRIVHDASGRPGCVLPGLHCELSISHESAFSMAMALVWPAED